MFHNNVSKSEKIKFISYISFIFSHTFKNILFDNILYIKKRTSKISIIYWVKNMHLFITTSAIQHAWKMYFLAKKHSHNDMLYKCKSINKQINNFCLSI